MKKKLLLLLCFIVSVNTIHSQVNWELLNPKPTASTGKDVDFVTNEMGYIITSSELLETHNAGDTWSKKQDIASGNDMSFYNTTGYIVGNEGYVLKSQDSGTSWNQVFTGFNGSFNTVNIIDADTVILSTSNSIVKTNDGGNTWVSFSIPNGAVNKTCFTGALTGHAVCNNGTILKTVDGGQNWYVTVSTNSFPSGFFTVYFVNPSVGFASREFDYLFKTTDGGETWTQMPYNGELIYDFHFLNPDTGFATGEYGATYKTFDGGSTWNQIFFQNGYIDNTSMYGIYFQDNNIGYATGARGRIIKTTNGGATWTGQSKNYNDFRQLQFINENIAYAETGSDFYKTVDAGNTWNLVGSLALGSSVSSSDFTFVDENLGYATTGGSYGGQVYKTTNGGVTWSILNNGADIIDEGIASIHFLDANTGFISGGFNQRKVMKTTNGGTTWAQVFNQTFGQIQFFNNLTGYANRVGYSNGIMYKTTDGGTTWNATVEIEHGIRAFDFVDENNGYFIGDYESVMYKTNDGGASWQQLQVPYGFYTEINFQTKNVGFIADENGALYKTENGGLDWEHVTSQYRINSIELINDKIYTAGTSGKIYRSDVDYQPIFLHVNPAENITNSGASITGDVVSNGGTISDIQFEYGLSYSFGNVVATTPGTVNSNDALNVSLDLSNLETNTTYYYRLKAVQGSNTVYSDITSFTTLPDYQITTDPIYNYASTTATISGTIVSNGYDITNVEFQYGLSAVTLDSTVGGSPASVAGNTTGNITASLVNLMPETHYFYRIKATHQGQDIYGDIQSFTTYPEYNINAFNPNVNGSNATLSAYLTSYGDDITDVVFEYGTTGFENTISTTPSQINANSSGYVSATLTNLDPNLNYHYRLKGTLNGEAIYGQQGIFNLSGNTIIVSGTATLSGADTLELKGLINSYGAFLTNVHFEYGLTDGFGMSAAATPNYVYGYNTNSITAAINGILPNQTYYYRLVANKSGNSVFSDTYQYTTGTLGLPDLNSKGILSMYPNPAIGFLNLKTNSDKIRSVEFYNALGQRVHREDVPDSIDIKLNVSNFERGMYLIKVSFESGKVASLKVILK